MADGIKYNYILDLPGGLMVSYIYAIHPVHPISIILVIIDEWIVTLSLN